LRKQDVQSAPTEPPDAQLLSLRPGTVWQAFRQEHFGFAYLCLYLLLLYLKPWQAHRWLDIIPWERLTIVIVMIGFILGRQYKVPRNPLNWLLVLLLLHCIVSSALAYNPYYAFSKLDVIAVYVLVYFLVTGIVNSERRLLLFVLVYFLANFKMSEFGFLSWAHRGFHFASWGITGAGWYRNSGEDGMEMAMFFNYILCFAIVLRKYWSKWMKRFIYFVAMTAAGCVLASSSRGAVLALGAGLVYLILLSDKKAKSLIGTALLVVIAYLLIPDRFVHRFDTAGHDITSDTRLDYWAKARLMMNHHPFFGVGYYNWIPYYRDHYFHAQIYWRVEMAHNTFLQLGAEIGYIGLILFVALTVISFSMNIKSTRLAKSHGFDFLYSFGTGMNVAGVSMVVGSIFLTAFWLPSYWIYFAFSACLRNIILQRNAALQPVSASAINPGTPAVPYARAAR
jgi:putative inorganic carbon (hco3(-)) transporter